jgi:WD40 repeat protein
MNIRSILLASLIIPFVGCGKDPVRSDREEAQPNEDRICVLYFSPDGRILASGDTRGTVAVRDGTTGRVISWVRPHRHVRAVAFTPDGKQLVTVSGDQDLRIERWNPAGGASRHTMDKHYAHESAVTLNREGTVAAVAFSYDEVGGVLVDTASGDERPYAAAVEGQPLCLAFSPDGALLAESVWLKGNRGQITLRNGTTGEKIWSYPDTKKDSAVWRNPLPVPMAVAFSRDARLVAAAGEGWLHVLDAKTGRSVWCVHGEFYTHVAFMPDGRTVAAAPTNRDGIRLWNTEKGTSTVVGEEERGYLGCMAVSPDGAFVARGGQTESIVRLFPAAGGR